MHGCQDQGQALISKHWYRCHLTHDWRVEWMVDDEERTVVITHLGPREEK